MRNSYIEKAKENVKHTEIFVEVRENILSGYELNIKWIAEDIEQTKDSLSIEPESSYYINRLKNLNYKMAVYELLTKEIDSLIAEILQGGLDNYIKVGGENE